MFSPPIFLCYYWLVLVFLLNFVALDVLSAADEFVFNQFTSTPSINVVAPMFIGQVVLATLFAACPEIFECSPSPLKKRPPICRERRSVRSIMNELGESYVPRAYKMKEESFWILLTTIAPYLKNKSNPPLSSTKTQEWSARPAPGWDFDGRPSRGS